uniref:Recep_L_domain domain-containing protein n=1 Tax=Caenorhabditis japonica TaxID=281687 RepID=A0A8R1E8Q2_CAEJA
MSFHYILLSFHVLLTFPRIHGQCAFNLHHLTASSKFPANCSQIFGRFTVDQTSGVTDAQLSEIFANVKEIQGVVQIWNTQFTSVNFLKTIERLTGDYLDKSLSIVNNSRLTSLDLPSLVKSNGKLEIVNNPVLNLRSQCSTFHSAFFNRRSVSGNEFDCGCDLIVPFKWSSVKNFPTGCVVLYGNLVLEGSAPPVEVLYRMSAVTKLYGNLEVKQTNLETLGFLQNLEEIESGT